MPDQPLPPPTPPELPEADSTRRQTLDDRTRAMPPVNRSVNPPQPPPPPSRRPAPPAEEKPKRGQPPPPPPAYAEPRRAPESRSALSIPLWSVGLMLMMVCGVISCGVLAVIGLGGNVPPAAPPRFVIITAVPTESPEFTPPPLAVPPTLPAVQGVPPSLSLLGPTLPPVIISPTPDSIGIGKSVVVSAEDSGLNVRNAPGTIGTRIEFVAPAGEVFTVVDGPAQADGFTWWKLQSPTDPSRQGWGAAVFIEIAPSANPA